MKLIIVYEMNDMDLCSWDVILPIEYESLEELKIDFEKAARAVAAEHQKAKEWNHYFHHGQFTIGGHTFDFSDFFDDNTYIEPDFYTLGEWFDKFKG